MGIRPRAAAKLLQDGLNNCQIVDAYFPLERLRARKTKAELTLLREASERVLASMLAVFNGCAPGQTKDELVDRLRREEVERGLTFEYCLMSAGKSFNRAPSDQRLESGDIFSLDSGGNYKGYIGDLCRMGILGEPDAELVDLLGVIEEIQQRARRPIRRGAAGADIFAAVGSFGHLGPISPGYAFLEAGRRSWRVHFSPDGARVLTTNADHTAKLWDAALGRLLSSFAHQDEVFQAEFSSDGARILTASRDKTAKLWDAASGELIGSFEHPDGLYHAAFSPDGARILTASGDRSAKLWDPASGKLIAPFDHQDTVPWAGFSPDGTRFLTVSWDKTAKVWDAATPFELARRVKEAGGDTARMGSSVSIANSPTQQVESLSEIASGLEFLACHETVSSNEGSLVAVDEEHRSKLTKELQDLAQGVGPNARFIRWFSARQVIERFFPRAT